MSFDLWPFQGGIVSSTQAALRKHRAVCMVCPTGSGKTVIAGAISVRLAKELRNRKGGIALYLVHRKELIRQTVNTLTQAGLGDQVGVIAAGYPGAPWAPLQVASIQTLHRRVEKVKQWLDPAVLFVDEAHHAAAATWARLIDAFPGAYRIGMTATPARLDGRGLGLYFDHLVQGPQISDLLPEYLAPSRTLSIDPKYDLKALARRRFSQKAAGEVQTGPVIADMVWNWRQHGADRKTLFFCVDRRHSQRTAERLQAEGFRAEHVDFKTPWKQREHVLREYERGTIQCLTNVELFTEGTDAPATSCVVHGRPTNSFTLWRQINGRGMRRKPEGGDNLVIDCVGNVRHGLPDADVEWELEFGVGDDQRKALKADVRVCEACNYAYEIKFDSCPLCGVAPPKKDVQEFKLELTEVTEPTKPTKPTKRQLNERILATGGDKGKLDELRKEYGYHPQWSRRMANLYGFGWR